MAEMEPMPEPMEPEGQQDFEIYIEVEKPSLFELSYLTMDLFNLSILGSVIQNNELEKLDELYFGRGYFSFPSRFVANEYILNNHKQIELKKLSIGSIEIILPALSLVSSIIVPFIIHSRSQERFININFNSKDPVVKQILNDLEAGYYGTHFDDRFAYMVEQLASRGYSIEMVSQKLYKITSVINNNVDYMCSVKRIHTD